jgi:hypothetical protein
MGAPAIYSGGLAGRRRSAGIMRKQRRQFFFSSCVTKLKRFSTKKLENVAPVTLNTTQLTLPRLTSDSLYIPGLWTSKKTAHHRCEYVLSYLIVYTSPPPLIWHSWRISKFTHHYIHYYLYQTKNDAWWAYVVLSLFISHICVWTQGVGTLTQEGGMRLASFSWGSLAIACKWSGLGFTSPWPKLPPRISILMLSI